MWYHHELRDRRRELREELLVFGLIAGHPWSVAHSPPWLHLRSRRVLADQGWKLHLSAHRGSVHALLDAALPVLAAHDVNAKIVCDESTLVLLNDGQFGLTQVGKVVTIYPRDVDEALVLAEALDDATAAIDGPAIPFDARLHATSSVFYRYGSFRTRVVRTPFGEALSVVADASGALVPDDRTRPVPPWLEDPFVAAGVAHPRAPSSVLADRFALLGVAARSARGVIHPAIDLVDLQPCTAKRAMAWATIDGEGRDARDRLRNEAELLRALHGRAPVPGVRDVVVDGDDVVLVMDEVPGVPLDQWVRGRHLAGTEDAAATRRLARNLVAAVASLHEAGVVLCDLSARNVLVTDDGDVHLIDFEIAQRVGDDRPRYDRSTIGFGAPAQVDGTAAVTPADDLFALGSLLWLLVTGRAPYMEPGLTAMTRDRALLAAPDADPGLLDLMLACLSREVSRRPASARGILDALDRPEGERRTNPTRRSDRQALTGAVHRAGTALVADLDELLAAEDASIDLASGIAGLVLAASTLAELLDDDVFAAAADRGATRLCTVDPNAFAVPGLFVGLAGLAVALVHPIVVDDARRATAARFVAVAAALEAPDFDVVIGTAGVARAAQLVGVDATDECEALARHVRDVAGDDRWPLPLGFLADAGAPCLGYAHGATGIADVLHDQYAITGDERWLAAARAAIEPVARHVERRPDASVWWPNTPGGEPAPAVWCRGAGGAGGPLAKLGHDQLADACFASIAAERSTGPSRCHGLAGQVEMLLDAGRVDDALALTAMLIDYAPPGDSDAERRAWMPQGLLEGNAGLAIALARARCPEKIPWSAAVFGRAAVTR